ncbi:hypothetical protein [Aquimarina sp. 2304DJ70-9]|uniref:hypothetical protein n=1 Tax=Aquimarina penaris TaxID=3231044 RepID=UPI003461D131
MKTIPVADQNHVMNIDRGRLSNRIEKLINKRYSLMKDLMFEPDKRKKEIVSVNKQINYLALNKIREIDKKSKSPQGKDLILEMSKSGIQPGNVLMAMYNAASDNTPADQVMAGITYIVAAGANHPMARKLLNGAIHVDALSPKKYKKIQGGERASYQILTSGDKNKANTIYIPTNVQLSSIRDRATIIHELTHADDDFNTTSNKEVNELDFEAKAYKEEVKYFMGEYIKEQNKDINELKIGGTGLDFFDKNLNPIRYWALIDVMKNSTVLRNRYLKHFVGESFYQNIETDLASKFSANTNLRIALTAAGYSSQRNIELITKQGHFYHGKL